MSQTRPSTSAAPAGSPTSAGVTTQPSIRPLVSTSKWRFLPLTLLWPS